MKSQTALETIIILGVLLLIFTAVYSINSDMSLSLTSKYTIDKARNVVDEIARNAEQVYYQGEGSTIQTPISMPNNIYNATIQGKSIEINLYSNTENNKFTTIVRILEINVTGNISITPGYHLIRLESKGGFVNVSST